MKDQDVEATLQKMRDPQTMRSNLLLAALFIATQEVLKMVLVENLKGFFGDIQKVKGHWKAVSNEHYDEIVMKKLGDEYKASARWFRDQMAISEEEYQTILKIREHRDKVAAHGLPSLLIDPDIELDIDLLIETKHLIHKIDEWWIRNIEMSINPPDHIEDIESAEIKSGRMMMIDQIFSCVFSDVV